MSLIRKVLVTGGNGYVGNYILKTLASKHPDIECIGMSRRGTAREDATKNL